MATSIDVNAVLEQLAAEMAESDAKTLYKGFTVTDLRTVFDHICDPVDWKGPIAARVQGEAVMMTVVAIEFHTATTPTVTLNTNTMRYLIESEGYRQGPAGDH